MQDKQSVTPHDDYFKRMMEVRKNTSEVIQAFFPKDILDELDLRYLKHVDASFVDPDMGNLRADVVYECRFRGGKRLMITLLFEHKSYKVDLPHIQLLKYKIAIWERQQKNKDLPRLVLPVLFYHGRQDWEYKNFYEYFEGFEEGEELNPKFKKYFVEFGYIFVNLQAMEDEWIKREIRSKGLRMGLLLMRNIWADNLLESVGWILDGHEELRKTDRGRREFKEVLVYLLSNLKEPEKKIFKAMDHETYMNRPHPMGSTAWQIEEKGKAKGIVEGKAEGIVEGEAKAMAKVALSMLTAGFDHAQIIEMTGLSIKAIEKLKKNQE
jgi:predicted transposase/invertase (TIGR01784 family)